MKIIGIVSIAAAIALICVAALFSLDTASDHGKEVFAAQKCSMCHSIEGVGGKMKSLDGIGSKLKAEDIRKWIVTPREMKEGVIMKAYPDLPEKDLQDLVAYLVSLK